jgi:3-methyl-2-oxobutanoate hydroxymethyltransferase
MQSVLDFAKARVERRPIVMVTAYDCPSARTAAAAGVDVLLVGDSVAMAVHGHPSTLHATLEMMELHTAAVARGAGGVFTVADLPFLLHRGGVDRVLEGVARLMRAGAHAVKFEGVDGNEELVARLVGGGVPVMAHIGLQPQSVHALGGYRVQGRGEAAAAALVDQARRAERAGAFAVVVECVPSATAAAITAAVGVPTIGIGAGMAVSGQVLVWHDALGLQDDLRPRFVRRFAEGGAVCAAGLRAYADAVRAGTFPAEGETYA